MEYKVADVMNILEDSEAIASLPPGYGTVELEDGTRHRIHLGDMLIHGILWKNLHMFNMVVTNKHIYQTFPVDGKMISKCLSIQYLDILDQRPDLAYSKIVYQLWVSIFEIYKFVYTHLGEYQRTVDLVDLMDVCSHPKIKKLIDPPLPAVGDTKVAEIEFDRRSKELIKLLSTPGEIENNPLIDFLQVGAFNSNQVPQLLMALGTRGDIDGTILPHVMNCSAVSGMKTLADYATESASPKITSFYNHSVIRDTQSFYREMRLLTCNLNIPYKGDCGSRIFIPHRIEKGNGPCYIDKLVRYNGEMVAITDENCRSFEGVRVELKSPVACRYVDGVCESCAGRATKRPWAFFPDVRIGGYATAVVFSNSSQLVLSAKHLIRTFTIAIEMTKAACKFLTIDAHSNLRINKKTVTHLQHWELLINSECIGHPNDLLVEEVTPLGFGKFNKIAFRNIKTDTTYSFSISTNDMIQHFSKNMLDHMRDNREKIRIVDDCYAIPLEGYSSRFAIIDVVAKNDDMVAFQKRVETMFRKGISEYPNIELAMSNIISEILSKAKVNVFLIELVIKAILNSTLPEDGSIDIKTIREEIASNNVAAKLGHAHVNDYLFSPAASVVSKQKSPFDLLFGF